MPIKSCQSDKNPGFKWGDAGKCYTYEPKNEGSIRNARKKATAQGIAIGDIKLEGLKVSFDYHETLTTDKGKKLLEKEQKENNNLYIISAARDINELLPFAEKYGIRIDHVYAIGSNQKKVDKIKELGIVRHYDNSQQVKDIIDSRDDLNVELIRV
jgi:hypothetical protein